MTRITYGVSGEGSGHSSRAREMVRFLQGQGHEVRLASYDRGYRNLADEFDVLEIEGLTIASSDNRVSVLKTVTENLRRLTDGHRKLLELKRELFEGFQPHCVITDFEPMTAYLAKIAGLPLITLDNQHRMRYLDYETPPDLETDRRISETVIRAMVPFPSVSLVTAFVGGEPTNDRTFVFPPMVRGEVRSLRSESTFSSVLEDDGAILVYVTSGFDSLIKFLPSFRRERFWVYGTGRSGEDGNLSFRPFSKEGFLGDLVGCKAVIATAGFTLISEALHLEKPYLAFPMEGQFEQRLNAFQLENSGYGREGKSATRETLASFLYDLPKLKARLVDYPRSNNREIEARLEELVAEDAQGARAFLARRGSGSSS